jgi:xanthine dehydrogenase accessory factor
MKTYVLGASLGQCCGGKVGLRLSVVDAAKVMLLRKQLARERYPLILFGAGHVGRALVRVLAGSPFSITWVDPREDAFSENDVDTSWLHICQTDDPTEALDDAVPGSYALVMTHRHDLDYDLSKQAIMRDDLSFVGLIGSATKKASFLGRLQRDGCAPENISRLQCPIGVAGITGKEPYAIAVSVAAQLLQRLEISGRVCR